MRRLACLVLFSVPALLQPRPAAAQEPVLDGSRVVDLTHVYNEETVYWPTAASTFELEQLAHGMTEAGYFYSANAFATPEHGGTHIDAPIHFAEDGWALDEVPVEQLMGPAVVIDISDAAARDPGYRLTREDVRAFERRNGRIRPGTIVLLRTGWSRFWPEAERYLGPSAPADASDLRFPSYGPGAARLLVEEREVAVLGIDAASIDYGASTEFMVHRIAGAADVPGLENLTGLDELPPTGATVIALPMKIEGGSGGPVRVVALLPPER